MEALLGKTLSSKQGDVNTREALAGKTVVLYFSAHWCPPCRGTTPLLAKAHEKLIAAGKQFEVVFVSSDSDEKSFKEYYGEMPWLALPYAKRDIKEKLSKKYKVEGIPSLVVVDEHGETITTSGRGPVLADDNVETFPWIPKTVFELLGDTFVKNSETGIESVGVESIKGKVLALYFSANWCGPCRAMTPKLVETYQKAKAKGLDFEVVFVSSCKDEKKFEEYFSNMPWLALPFAKRDAQAELSERFGVEGIPHVVVLDSHGKVTNPEAGADIIGSDAVDSFPWNPPAVVDLNKDPSAVNSEKCLLFECQDVAKVSAYKESVSTIKAASPDLDVFFFLSGDPSGPVASQLHSMGVPKSSEQLVMLNLPDEGAYYVAPDSAVTVENISSFVENFEKAPQQNLSKP